MGQGAELKSQMREECETKAVEWMLSLKLAGLMPPQVMDCTRPDDDAWEQFQLCLNLIRIESEDGSNLEELHPDIFYADAMRGIYRHYLRDQNGRFYLDPADRNRAASEEVKVPLRIVWA